MALGTVCPPEVLSMGSGSRHSPIHPTGENLVEIAASSRSIRTPKTPRNADKRRLSSTRRQAIWKSLAALGDPDISLPPLDDSVLLSKQIPSDSEKKDDGSISGSKSKKKKTRLPRPTPTSPALSSQPDCLTGISSSSFSTPKGHKRRTLKKDTNKVKSTIASEVPELPPLLTRRSRQRSSSNPKRSSSTGRLARRRNRDDIGSSSLHSSSSRGTRRSLRRGAGCNTPTGGRTRGRSASIGRRSCRKQDDLGTSSSHSCSSKDICESPSVSKRSLMKRMSSITRRSLSSLLNSSDSLLVFNPDTDDDNLEKAAMNSSQHGSGRCFDTPKRKPLNTAAVKSILKSPTELPLLSPPMGNNKRSVKAQIPSNWWSSNPQDDDDDSISITVGLEEDSLSDKSAEEQKNDDDCCTLETKSCITTSSSTEKKSVSFSKIYIFEFPIILGDHPSISSGGAPITLGWKCKAKSSHRLDVYERFYKPPHHLRHGRRELGLPPEVRGRMLLRAGYRIDQICEATLEVQRVQQQRRETLLEKQGWEVRRWTRNIMESASRALRSTVMASSSAAATTDPSLLDRLDG